MPDLYQLTLFRPNTGAAVICGATHGVRAVLTQGPSGWVALLADTPENTGVSATNGVLRYMETIAEGRNLGLRDIAWLELDSLGRIDQVVLIDGSESFQPWLGAVAPDEQLKKLLPLFGAHATEALRWALRHPA